MLMYPLGAQSVKCSVCHYVTHVSQQANWGGSGSAGQQQAAQPQTQTVVVENPPSLDEKGNEVRNYWVGCLMQAARRRLGPAVTFAAVPSVCSELCCANPTKQLVPTATVKACPAAVTVFLLCVSTRLVAAVVLLAGGKHCCGSERQSAAVTAPCWAQLSRQLTSQLL
jgi:LSD1 subclass zinc finger protein